MMRYLKYIALILAVIFVVGALIGMSPGLTLPGSATPPTKTDEKIDLDDYTLLLSEDFADGSLHNEYNLRSEGAHSFSYANSSLVISNKGGSGTGLGDCLFSIDSTDNSFTNLLVNFTVCETEDDPITTRLQFRLEPYDDSSHQVRVLRFEGGKIYVTNRDETIEIGSLMRSMPTKISLLVDIETNTMKVWLNDRYIDEFAIYNPYPGSKFRSYLYLYCAEPETSSVCSLEFDNFKVYTKGK